MPSVYRLEHYEHEVVAVLTNKSPTGPYRGVGWTVGHTAREVFFDEIARALVIDPAEFRWPNMISSDSFPHRSCTGAEYDSGSYCEALQKALDMVDYGLARRAARGEQARAAPRYRHQSLRRADRVRERDLASVELPAAVARQLHRHHGFDRKGAGGTRHLLPGPRHKTSFAQLAADVLGVDPSDVEIVQGDTDVTPFGMGTFASRGAVIGGGSLALAAGEVRSKLLDVAAQLLEAAPADIRIEGGQVLVAGSPADGIAVEAVADAAYFAPEFRAEGVDPYLSATRFYDPKATYSNGCIVAVCEVDPKPVPLR